VVEAYLYWLQHEPGSRLREALVFGDSRIAHAFSAEAAGAVTGNRIRFWNFGIAGTLPRDWYYILRDADPGRHRFAVVVLALDQYSDEDYDDVFADRVVDLNFLIARLRLSDCAEFASSMKSEANRRLALWGCFLKGAVLRQDLGQFVQSVPDRLKRAREWREHGLAFVNGFDGIDRSLQGLSADWRKHTITYPAGLDEASRLSIRATVMPHWPAYTGETTRYRERWLRKIFDLYKDSPTRIVLLELPRAPLPKPDGATPAVFLKTTLPREHVQVLAASTFRDLEQPEYFFDGLHLNRKGRAIFSARLGREIGEIAGVK
jgi:hypothetical protein